jgi:hypothetical protein
MPSAKATRGNLPVRSQIENARRRWLSDIRIMPPSLLYAARTFEQHFPTRQPEIPPVNADTAPPYSSNGMRF